MLKIYSYFKYVKYIFFYLLCFNISFHIQLFYMRIFKNKNILSSRCRIIDSTNYLILDN